MEMAPPDARIRSLAVGVGNVIATLLLVVPLVPDDAVVEAAACVPAQLVSDGARS